MSWIRHSHNMFSIRLFSLFLNFYFQALLGDRKLFWSLENMGLWEEVSTSILGININPLPPPPGNFFMLFYCLLIFFKITFFSKNSYRNTVCQTDWIQITPDILSGLIWVQTVCKGYQQTTLGGKELTVEGSGSVGRVLDGIEGLLVQDSLSVESLCCSFEQETLSAA